MDILAANFLSPVPLAFLLGMVATFLRSDLRLPEAIYSGLSIYLLLAIGFKGGIELSRTPPLELLAPAAITLVLGVVTPLVALAGFRKFARLSLMDSSALAAHYGSVSAVTFIAAVAFCTSAGARPEGFMPALVAILEVPGIVVALLALQVCLPGGGARSLPKVLHEVLAGKSIVLLVGGLLIGWIAGVERMEKVTPFFTTMFTGALVLFMIELGTLAGRRIREIHGAGWRFLALTIVVPLINGSLGVALGTVAGLSPGGAAVLGAMAGSASYIAAPAAVRIALPDANPSYYLTASLGLTFPFNLALGIPLYLEIARRLA